MVYRNIWRGFASTKLVQRGLNQQDSLKNYYQNGQCQVWLDKKFWIRWCYLLGKGKQHCFQMRMPDKILRGITKSEEIPKSWILGDFMRRFLSGEASNQISSPHFVTTSHCEPARSLIHEMCRSYDQRPNLASSQACKENFTWRQPIASI